jgi:hypothetical protein
MSAAGLADDHVPGTTVVLAAAAAALSATYGPLVLHEVDVLDGSPRTYVVRARTEGRADLPTTVVVKVHAEATTSGSEVREPAALGLLTAAGWGLTPRLLAVADDPPLVVMEDLGAGLPDLAGALLGTDRALAERLVLAWADAVAHLHARTSGWTDDLGAALTANADRLGRGTPATNGMPDALELAATTLAEELPGLGVEPTAEALDVLRQLDGLLGGGAACWALSPSDACPDNNLVTDRGMLLLDFEGAQVRHVAWDAAYLTVPWPSCWCSWRLPDDVAGRALGHWRNGLAAVAPHVTSTDFEADLAVAEMGWALMSTSWFLETAMREADERLAPPPDAVTPSKPATLQHRLSLAAATSEPRLAPLRDLAAEVHAAALARWGDVSLPLAPAFR